MWRRKKRKPVSFIKYLFISFGLIFLIGNAAFLKGELTGFIYGKSQLQLSADFEDEYPNNNVIELPISALSQQTKLRHLMQNAYPVGENVMKSKDTKDNSSLVIDIEELKRTLLLTSECNKIVFDAKNDSFIGAGWTKAVYKGHLNGKTVAIKTVHKNGFDASKCLTDGKYNDINDCYKLSTKKILKEITLLEGLKHPNILQVAAHCIPRESEDSNVYLATELGEPLDLIKLLQMSWEDRLRIAYGLTKLLHFLAHSPYGSIILNDLQRQQFVLLDGEIKLSDMDDAAFSEPACNTHNDCTHFFLASNFTLRTNCQDGRCVKYNEKMNIYNTGRHFTQFLLPHGCPSGLRGRVDTIVQGFNNASLDIKELLKLLSDVVVKYSTGEYLDGGNSNSQAAYVEFLRSDLPGQHDFTCHYNVGPVCTLSVHNRLEAETLCDNDSNCAGFVLSSKTTWTGRMLAHFKNAFSAPSYNGETKLYVKPGFVT